MGFNVAAENARSAEPLWQNYREYFPVTRRFIYLNHAAVAPLSKPAADAMQALAQEVLEYGSLHYDKWMNTYEGLRVAAARLIGADRSEIALVKNTSEGIATVAMGLDWRLGDKVVAFEEEFPANVLPWKRLEESRQVRVEWMSAHDPLEKIDEACRGARLLAISFVQYLSGFRADLEAIGEICRRRNCFFLVDAIQGLGAFPMDVERYHIDALASDGHKWMLGPEGCGILYVRRHWQDEIEPVEFGWTNVAGYADYAAHDMTLREDAGRYECGTLNTIGCYGLRAAIEFLLEVDVTRIAPAVQAHGDRLADGARRKGYEILGNRTRENGAGIVSVRKPGIDGRMIVHDLKKRGILAAPRAGWVRMSPHFYVSPEEIERVIELLP
jgi:selenocysteine lyase/cysteine desulfurase